MLKHKKILGATIIAGIGLGYLIYVLLGSSVAYYSTVSEMKDEGASVVGQHIRVSGVVSPDSVDFDAETVTLSFAIADDQASLPVVYKGVAPDAFKPEIQVVVEGELDSSGVFQATKLMTKCPSKYEPAS